MRRSRRGRRGRRRKRDVATEKAETARSAAAPPPEGRGRHLRPRIPLPESRRRPRGALRGALRPLGERPLPGRGRGHKGAEEAREGPASGGVRGGARAAWRGRERWGREEEGEQLAVRKRGERMRRQRECVFHRTAFFFFFCSCSFGSFRSTKEEKNSKLFSFTFAAPPLFTKTFFSFTPSQTPCPRHPPAPERCTPSRPAPRRSSRRTPAASRTSPPGPAKQEGRRRRRRP